jgi:hypothetical protein
MLSQAGNQAGGSNDWQNGTGQRFLAADNLREMLSDLVYAASKLDAEAYPTAGALRMPRSSGLQALRDSAQAALGTIGPIKAAFVELDWPADVDEQLAALIEAFDTATTTQTDGHADQVGATAGLKATAKAGVKAVRLLDAVLRRRYRNDPVLLAGWKSASHIVREPVREDEEPNGETPAPLLAASVNTVAPEEPGAEPIAVEAASTAEQPDATTLQMA